MASLSRSQALILSATIYVCAVALVILLALYVGDPNLLWIGLLSVAPDLLPSIWNKMLPAVGRFLNPKPPPNWQHPYPRSGWPSRPRESPTAWPDKFPFPQTSNAPPAPQAPAAPTAPTASSAVALSAAGTVIYGAAALGGVALLLINITDVLYADAFDKNTAKALASSFTGIVSIISAWAGLSTRYKALTAPT
jgi:hypothetical protein